MATVSFRLDNPKNKDGSLKNEEVAIRVCLYVSKFKRPEVSTTLSISPKHWHPDKERAKATLTNHTKVNLRLDEIQKDLPTLWESNIEADHGQLKRLLQEYFRGKDWNIKPDTEKKKNDAPFVAYISKFIKDCEKGEIIRESSTIQSYRQTQDLLTAFAKAKNFVLSFESINIEFYRSFTSYLWDTEKQVDNTVGKHIKNIKTFMNNSFDEDLHTNLAFKKKKFQKITADTDEVYLTQDEIAKLYGLNLYDNPKLAITRDLFVFACWTGVRFGDLCSIRPEQVEQHLQGKFLRVHTEKTNADVIIPFHPLAEAIFSYYNYRLPIIEKGDNPAFNKEIKDICSRALLKSTHQSRTTKRGKATFEYLPKHKMVSAHTARRSFATNCYLIGVPVLTIMAITGHKTEKAFLKYIRISKEEHAKIMMDHFNTSPIISVMRKHA